MIMKMIVLVRKSLTIIALFPTLIVIALTSYSEAIIIDHNCTDINQVPDYWITQAKDVFNLSYGHTSHGSQLVTGMDMVINEHGALYDYTSVTSSCPFNGAFLCDRYPSGDLGNPDRTTWAQRTRDLLNNANNDRNVIIWSWCGQHNTTEENINLYLSQMNQLELDYPDVVFVYMTGHLNSGSGPPDGNTFLRNEQIRQYCLDNNKILFDFADIESWDPDGNDHRDDDDACYWCADWCSTHSCPSCGSCAHSHCFNCYQKGKAFWWMMARLAGWEPTSTTTTIEPGDTDGDGIANELDNCPDHPNGPLRGTCTEEISGDLVVNYIPPFCTSDGDCATGQYCEMWQTDNYPMPPNGVPNGVGDACDCEGDFNCDQSVDGLDVLPFIANLNKRLPMNNPCTNGNPCDGDFNCDTGVVGGDVLKFIEDWNKRLSGSNPCPPCDPQVPWCVYP